MQREAGQPGSLPFPPGLNPASVGALRGHSPLSRAGACYVNGEERMGVAIQRDADPPVEDRGLAWKIVDVLCWTSP